MFIENLLKKHNEKTTIYCGLIVGMWRCQRCWC